MVNSVLVPSKFVKPRHCRITNDAGTLKIKPLSEDADLCINGEPVNSGLGNALSLRHGDSLLLGTGSAAENCCFEVVNWSELIEDVRTGKRKELRPSEYVPNVTEHWYFEAQRGVYTDLIEEFNKNHNLDDDDDAPRAEVSPLKFIITLLLTLSMSRWNDSVVRLVDLYCCLPTGGGRHPAAAESGGGSEPSGSLHEPRLGLRAAAQDFHLRLHDRRGRQGARQTLRPPPRNTEALR